MSCLLVCSSAMCNVLSQISQDNQSMENMEDCYNTGWIQSEKGTEKRNNWHLIDLRKNCQVAKGKIYFAVFSEAKQYLIQVIYREAHVGET